MEKRIYARLTPKNQANDKVTESAPAIKAGADFCYAMIGANANMLNPTFTTQQLADRIRETDASVLVVVNELYPSVKDAIRQTKIRTVVSYPAVNSLGLFVKLAKKAKKIPGTLAWNDFIKAGNSAVPGKELPYEKDAPAIMVYSSGTTGASKGIQLTNDGINATTIQYESTGFDMKRQDRYFAQIPIWFSTGIVVTMLVPLCLGITVILEPQYDFELFYQHIEKYKPNFLITAVGLVDYLRSKKEISPAYKAFKYLAIGGEYVTPHAESVFNNWLEENGSPSKLHKGYGMCECGGTVTTTIPKSNKVGSSGVPMAKVTVAAFDLNTGEELKYGQRGEIRVLTPCRMLGYYKNPKATADYFKTDKKGNEWACTGDMGYVLEDGSVYVDGRISDSYANARGETIYLFDIERTILSIDAVRQCKTVVSEINGAQTHVAHISLDKGQNNPDAVIGQIRAVCREKLPENHFPHYLKIHADALPVAPSGKLNTAMMKSDIQDLIEI